MYHALVNQNYHNQASAWCETRPLYSAGLYKRYLKLIETLLFDFQARSIS